MVFLPSVNITIRINSLYRTAARHIQTFVFWIAERGNWLSVQVGDTPEHELETQPERSSMTPVEWFNDQIMWTAAENPNLPKATKISYLTKACNLLCESLRARVRLTLARKKQKVDILAA